MAKSRSKKEYVTACDTERDVFLDVIDARVRDFLAAISSVEVEADVLQDLERWVEQTRVELRGAFSEWYRDVVAGTEIPKELVVPAPRQDRVYKKFGRTFADRSCEVCGDTRVLNIVHIIPRADGGPDEEWNLMRLCADHHHLFDSMGLTEDEWNSIDWASKDKRAREYAEAHQLAAHRRSWESTP